METIMFNQEKAEQHLKMMLKRYKIKVIKWSKGSCGRAYIGRKEIKIPKPTNTDRFCVCMHEIKHIIDGFWGKKYQMEYSCDMFAIEQAEELGFDAIEYRERARRYVIMNISKGYVRRLNLNNIDNAIREFCNIDFSEWEGKKVFVSGWGRCVRDGKLLSIQFN